MSASLLQCMELVDLTNNHTICRTCPVFGTEEGAIGNELGYVVRELEDDVSPPYTLHPGTPVRVKVRCCGLSGAAGVRLHNAAILTFHTVCCKTAHVLVDTLILRLQMNAGTAVPLALLHMSMRMPACLVSLTKPLTTLAISISTKALQRKAHKPGATLAASNHRVS